MRHLTIRNVPPELARCLDDEKRARKRSLNQVVLDLLSQAVGLGCKRSNGLASLAGRWSSDDLEELEHALEPTRQIDDELWR